MSDLGPRPFETIGKAFKAVEVKDSRVPTVQFLDACATFVKLFDVLGGASFSVVKKDMMGNVTKLRKAYEKDPSTSATLQDIVELEIKNKTTLVKDSSTDALMWLKRGLTFLIILCDGIFEGKTMKDCAAAAYDGSLSPYHGWAIRQVFKLAMKAVPTRESFMKNIGPDEETGIADLKEFLEVFRPQLKIVQDFYEANNCEDTRKV